MSHMIETFCLSMIFYYNFFFIVSDRLSYVYLGIFQNRRRWLAYVDDYVVIVWWTTFVLVLCDGEGEGGGCCILKTARRLCDERWRPKVDSSVIRWLGANEIFGVLGVANSTIG